MKKTVALFLSVLMIFSLASCKKSEEKEAEKVENDFVEYEEKGEGTLHFFLDIYFESDEKHYEIKTNETIVGNALEALKIIEGEEGPYGMYISSVEGETHVYEDGGKYWAFYVNDKYAEKGIDQTGVEDGATYSLKVE